MNEGHIQGPRNQLSEEYLKHGDFLSLVIILNVRLNAHEMILLCHCFVIDTGLEKLLHVSSPSSVLWDMAGKGWNFPSKATERINVQNTPNILLQCLIRSGISPLPLLT